MIEYDIRTKHNRYNQIKVRINWLIRDNWKGKNEQSRIRLVRRYKMQTFDQKKSAVNDIDWPTLNDLLLSVVEGKEEE